MEQNPNIQVAIGLLGGPAEVARILSRNSYQSVQQWRRSGAVPAKCCRSSGQATLDAVTVQNLQPDDWHLFWPPKNAIQSGAADV